MVAPVPQDITKVTLQGEVLEVVSDFFYHDDATEERGGCHDAIAARIRSVWNKYRELLQILSCQGSHLEIEGNHSTHV